MYIHVHVYSYTVYKLTMFEKMQGGASLTPSTSRMVLAHVLGFTLSTALLVQVERLGIFHLGSSKKCGHVGVNMPIGSMYAIYGNIYHQYTPNVSIYTIDGSYGMGQPLWFDGFFAECQEPKNVVFTSGSEEGK